MAFAVICKSCQARFLLNDDLLRRKVAGRVVTVRCRQCHATIEVDASEVDPKTLPETEKPAAKATTQLMFKAPRPAPSPPRPPAKSTLMGIGAQRPQGASELVALSPGLLGVETATRPAVTTRHGFPEPPPPPGAVEELNADDWEVEGPSSPPNNSAGPESLDDFVEELPPSVPSNVPAVAPAVAPPIEDELPSSTGTPSLKALTHHDEHAPQPRVDDFLANMTAAMNGGIMTDAPPTIDVSHLEETPEPARAASDVDLSDFEFPERGAKTLPLFESSEGLAVLKAAAESASPAAPPTAGPPPRRPPARPQKAQSIDPPALELQGPAESTRERRNVVAPSTDSVPPEAKPRRSGLAAPLLVALAAAAAFLIWKRNAAHAPEPVTQAERGEQAAAPAIAPAAPAETATPVAEAASPSAAPSPDDDVSFTTVTSQPAAQAVGRVAPPPQSPAAAAPAHEAAPAVTPEPAPEPPAAPAEPAEPAGPFDRAAAAAALNDSAAQASACRKEGDPSGVASVVITFAPSGRVTSANISGPPFAGTPTGGCIASALRRTRVPAFDGDRVTVSKTIVIQ